MLSIHHVNCSSAVLKLNVFLSDVGCGGSSLSACVSGGEEAARAQSQPHAALPSNKTLARSPLDGTAWEIAKSSSQDWGSRVVRGEDGRKTPGHEAGLAQVSHPRPLAMKLLRGTKSSLWLLCQKPMERISFHFTSKPAAAAVFPGQEEQKPRVYPVPPQLWGDIGSHKLDCAVPVSCCGAAARRGWR